jgi:HPt (histidine-containing phosphotransfer) domain-containing protein
VDAGKGLDIFGGDEELYIEVLESYLSTTPGSLDKLRNVSAETLPTYAIAVHNVKSTSRTIGAENLGNAAFELEKMAKSGDLAGVLAHNEVFLKNAEELLANIRKWQQK